MDPLNLPPYDFRTQWVGETRMIFDPIRRKYVKLTPEEWVRQHLVQYLVQELGYPRALFAIEKEFLYQRMKRRADVVVYDRKGRPALMAECKAPDVEIRQAAFDQVAGYNTVVQARYLVVTNGRVHYCCAIDRKGQTYRFLDTIPPYEEL